VSTALRAACIAPVLHLACVAWCVRCNVTCAACRMVPAVCGALALFHALHCLPHVIGFVCLTARLLCCRVRVKSRVAHAVCMCSGSRPFLQPGRSRARSSLGAIMLCVTSFNTWPLRWIPAVALPSRVARADPRPVATILDELARLAALSPMKAVPGWPNPTLPL
jgi:hypothetical protein